MLIVFVTTLFLIPLVCALSNTNVFSGVCKVLSDFNNILNYLVKKVNYF